MNFYRLTYLTIFVFFFSLNSWAAGHQDLTKGMTYQEIKTWHKEFLAGTPTKAERLDAIRQIVKTSRYGEKGLIKVFKNFDTGYSIDPTIPGVERTALKIASPSVSQAKGHVRELIYAVDLYNDPRFQLVEMDKIVKRPWGKTDKDIVYRYGRGLYGRLEVKEVSLSSQNSDVIRIKGQIDKMAREQRRTGQPQILVSRHDLTSQLREYADAKGIKTFENVRTGKSLGDDVISSKEFRDILQAQARQVQRARTIQGGVQFGYGLLLLIQSTPDTMRDIQLALDVNTRSRQTFLRLGEHSSYTLAGGAMTLSGGAMLASQFAGESAQGNLFRLGKIGGIASLVALGAGEGFLVMRYRSGDVSSREFWTSQWVLGGSAIGGFAGSWGGGAIGGFLGGAPSGGSGAPAGASIGAAAGGFAGSWLGSKSTRFFADMYYDCKFAELDKGFASFVYARYGVQ